MKKGIFYALICALVVLFQTPDAQAAQKRLSIATGGTSGVYFPIGGAMARAVSKAGDIQATAESSNASIANVNLLTKYEIEIAFAQNDVTSWAFNGQNMFEKPLTNLRTMATLFPEHIHWLVGRDSGIKTLQDLKGKRVNIGAPGSGYEAAARAMLQTAGMTFDDFRASRLDAAGSVARYKDNQLDAAIFAIGYPAPGPMDIATSRPVTLISFDQAYMDKLVKEFPFFVPSKIPGGIYAGIDQDTITPAVMAILVTHDKMADDVIYAFLKNLFDNLPEVHASHSKAQGITLENALSGVAVAPLHPGAAKFYKERGLKFPEGVK